MVRPVEGRGEPRKGGTGHLRVFTATERHPDGDGPEYHPHTGYLVCDSTGKTILHVANHVGSMDEAPATVTLPAGNYVVLAQATGVGRVKVPVVVEAGRATVVQLDPPR